MSALVGPVGSRRSFLVVSSENQRSTRLSHDELVGVKCSTNLGCAVSQRRIAGVLCVEALSSHMAVQVGGHLGIDLLQERQKLLGAMTGM